MSRSNQQVLCTSSSSQLNVDTMIEDQSQTVQWVMGSTKWPPFMVQCAQKYKFSWPCEKVKKRSKVKTKGLLRNFIIPVNCWNDDWRSNSHGSMSYGVHKSVSDAHTDRQTDGLSVLPGPSGYAGDNKMLGLGTDPRPRNYSMKAKI